MVDERSVDVWKFPCRSQEFQALPGVTLRGDGLELIYDYETESGGYKQAKVAFGGVGAFSFTSFELCSPEQVTAYDKVVAVKESDWLGRLSSRQSFKSDLGQHYRIFFDEIGCYEIAASRFYPPPASE